MANGVECLFFLVNQFFYLVSFTNINGNVFYISDHFFESLPICDCQTLSELTSAGESVPWDVIMLDTTGTFVYRRITVCNIVIASRRVTSLFKMTCWHHVLVVVKYLLLLVLNYCRSYCECQQTKVKWSNVDEQFHLYYFDNFD